MSLRTAALSLTAAASLASGCANAPQQHSGASGASSGASGTGTSSSTGTSTTSESSGEGTSSAVAVADFADWCAAAAATQTASTKLGDELAILCNNGQPTDFFTNVLVSSAFDGTGSPTLKVTPGAQNYVTSDDTAKTTTAFFGVGIKMPISAQEHFDKVGPKAGDKASTEALTVSQGATQQTLDISPHNITDKNFTRGWTTHSISQAHELVLNITIETTSDDDQFTFKQGSSYMYAQSLEPGQPTQTIQGYSILTADLEVNGAGYLLSVAKIVTDNEGFPSIAESAIDDTAQCVVKVMYAAAAADGGTPAAVSCGSSGL